MLRRLAALAVLPALLACGGERPPPPVPPPVASPPVAAPPAEAAPDPAPPTGPVLTGDGCDLISEAEASEALGMPMHVTSPPGSRGCALDSTPPALTVEFMRVTRGLIYDEVAANAVAQPLDGIGDGAVFVPVNGEVMAQLHVVRGNRHLVTTLVATRPGLDLRARAEAFGRAVAGRL